ncbi:hypothetical protein DFJ58DRAFT_914898 [Suillus subalutaceus]|uniref:uncharacterized protein n=1 Tax=Suillus subalutaceus TaxID=48586 RepID=UPI001B862127|nr:uncharacterized protein DFJ58DRAFT_914898 [Suillus subalutaceus]KAG1849142.1 hypothetical protein DFJ58DRAFT_914898 [Suillus subalutaceus]
MATSNVENPAIAESSFDMSTEVVERMGIKHSSTGSSHGCKTFMACTPSWKVWKGSKQCHMTERDEDKQPAWVAKHDSVWADNSKYDQQKAAPEPSPKAEEIETHRISHSRTRANHGQVRCRTHSNISRNARQTKSRLYSHLMRHIALKQKGQRHGRIKIRIIDTNKSRNISERPKDFVTNRRHSRWLLSTKEDRYTERNVCRELYQPSTVGTRTGPELNSTATPL